MGTRIWQLFATLETSGAPGATTETNSGRLGDIAQTITAEYDVTEERCTSDLLALVGDLEKQELVTVS